MVTRKKGQEKSQNFGLWVGKICQYESKMQQYFYLDNTF